MGSLKISCALWSLTHGATMAELDKALETAASVGVKAVQPWCVDEPAWNVTCLLDPDRCVGAQRVELAKHIRSFGLDISGFCAQLKGPTSLGGFGEEEGLSERVRKTQEALRLAADMEAPIVTTHIGPIPEDRDSEVYKRFLESAGACAKVAEQAGSSFALETGQETAAVLKQFIEDVGSVGLRVNFDPANMLKHDASVSGVGVLKDYIVHTHAKDRHPETGKPTVGQGAVPWQEYLAALKDIGYDGWYALEDESGKEVVDSLTAGCRFLEQF